VIRAAGIETFGGEVKMLERAASQSLALDELVIAVRLAGIGNWDEVVRVGGWGVGRQLPLVLGVEAAGVVVAVGE
jgi:NADPH:quinone reductase-like Zn-dependent oxidoreductase